MMENDPERCNLELQRILDRSFECASRLEDLLHDERSALELQDTEKLGAVTTSKELCVQCLESLESERRTLCVAAGYDASESGMKDMLRWCDGSSVVTPVWNRLLQSARQCEALNRTNGAIGRLSYEHVMSALAVLSGGSGRTPLYSPEGQESVRFEQRPLGCI